MDSRPPTAADPIARFQSWLAAAVKSGAREPNAMSLATADAYGAPNVRTVLLKGVDARGFVFYTNLGSPKSLELVANPVAALCFYWSSLKRQVRVNGRTERVTDAEADAYFATRPRLSQIGAWASVQSMPMTDRFELERRCASVTLRFGMGPVARPPHWSGFRVVPELIEFWRERPFRRHERIRFTRAADGWQSRSLFP